MLSNHGRPRDFMREPFKTAEKAGGLPSDEALRRVIRLGFPGSAMPPFTFLSPKELDDLVGFIKTELFAMRAMRQAAGK